VEIVSNQTSRWVRVDGRGKRLLLAPFERRELSDEVAACFDMKALRAKDELDLEETPDIEIEFGAIVGGCAFLYFVVVGLLSDPLGPRWSWVVGSAVPLLVLTGAAGYYYKWKDLNAFGSSIVSAFDWFRQQVSLLIVLMIGAGIPAAAIYYAADVRGIVDTLVSPPPATDLDPETYAFVGRLLQFAFISTVSLLPALLYFLFDREQLQTIREQFVRQMFRLDGTLRTRRHVAAKYGRLMEEAFGRQRAGSRVLPGRRSPLFVATFVITLGWLLTLLNAQVGRIEDQPRELISLFTPRQSALTFGFLGAYFFALNTIVRGYVRKDLRPKSYSTITVRILTVAILAWVLEVPLRDDAPYLLALVFVAGIVPETALVYLQELLRQRSLVPKKLRPTDIVEAHPLTNLEGIDLYDRARLSDEGVTNVEGLAHHDLIELMLYTRIPVSRLVDWVDQAILYLHVGDPSGDDHDVGAARREALDILGAHGIRTATGLERAWRAASARDDGAQEFLSLLPRLPGQQRSDRIRLVLDVIEHEEWMPALRQWHSGGHLDTQPIILRASAAASATPSEPAAAEQAAEDVGSQNGEAVALLGGA
jgi:hypothetical protein